MTRKSSKNRYQSDNMSKLEKLEKQCTDMEKELIRLLDEVNFFKEENKKCEKDKMLIKDEEWKKNREDCASRIMDVNRYYEKKIDKLEKELNDEVAQNELHKFRTEEYRKLLKNNGIFV